MEICRVGILAHQLPSVLKMVGMNAHPTNVLVLIVLVGKNNHSLF